MRRNGNDPALNVRCVLAVWPGPDQAEVGASTSCSRTAKLQELAMSTLRHVRTRSIWANEHAWIHSASAAQITLISAFAGFLVCGTAAMWEWIAMREGWSLLPMALVSNVIAGTLTALFVFVVLRNARERRLAMLRRLMAIREMNHEIRNALELIQLSAYSTHHQQAIATITNAVDRIQWTLREIVTPTAEAEETTAERDQT
jgi:hypothetical protein